MFQKSTFKLLSFLFWLLLFTSVLKWGNFFGRVEKTFKRSKNVTMHYLENLRWKNVVLKEMKKSQCKCLCTGPNSSAGQTFFLFYYYYHWTVQSLHLTDVFGSISPVFQFLASSPNQESFPFSPESTITHFHGQVQPWKINHPVAAALIGHCRAITGGLIAYPPPTSFPFRTSQGWLKRRLNETHHFLPAAGLTSIASCFKVSLCLPLRVLG